MLDGSDVGDLRRDEFPNTWRSERVDRLRRRSRDTRINPILTFGLSGFVQDYEDSRLAVKDTS